MPLTEEILEAVRRKIGANVIAIENSENDLKSLKSIADSLDIKYFRYLLLCFAFALRPKEADDFINGKAQVLIDKDGMKYLEIDQTKLSSTEKEKRIKKSPFINKYQIEVEQFFNDKKGNFLRPPTSWVDENCKDPNKSRRITDVYTNYAPRKGYVDSAKTDQSLLSIARHMGHLRISTTYEHYYDKNQIEYDENVISKKIKSQNGKPKKAKVYKMRPKKKKSA